jgi:hypothetical protein
LHFSMPSLENLRRYAPKELCYLLDAGLLHIAMVPVH